MSQLLKLTGCATFGHRHFRINGNSQNIARGQVIRVDDALAEHLREQTIRISPEDERSIWTPAKAGEKAAYDFSTEPVDTSADTAGGEGSDEEETAPTPARKTAPTQRKTRG